MSQVRAPFSAPENDIDVLPTPLQGNGESPPTEPRSPDPEQEAPPASYEPFSPPAPDSLADTGLSPSYVTGLLLKILHQHGALRGDEIADVVALPFSLIDDLLLRAQQRHHLEVVQSHGHGRVGYTYSLTSEGRSRAQAELDTSLYVGAAPVPLETFRKVVEAQSVRGVHVQRETLESAFSDLVLPPGVIDALGPAVNSGGSIFLHGAPGNGKTATAERIGSLTSNTIFLPQALLIHGHVMVLYDPVYHEKVEDVEPPDSGRSPLFSDRPLHDRRFVKIKRPTVFVGGELTMDQLDLQYDPHSKVYQAPFQLKAAGGVLIIDDFGRQRMRPEELLNRWIVPLEKGFDNLTLHTGIGFPVPFDCILILATNLNPIDLVDEAFLRRIQFKVEVRSPDRAAFEQIMRMTCEEFGVAYQEDAVALLYTEYYEAQGFAPRGCHPRDLLKQIQAMSAYEGAEPTLDAESLHRAAHSYFLVTEEEFSTGIPSLT